MKRSKLHFLKEPCDCSLH